MRCSRRFLNTFELKSIRKFPSVNNNEKLLVKIKMIAIGV